MTNQDRSEELTDWIHAIERWKQRHRKAKNLLDGIEELLRKQEEAVDKALWMRATARNKGQISESDGLLSDTVAAAQKNHESTVRALDKLHRQLESTDLEGHFERPQIRDDTADDPVDEASRESFPASDPPSFTPGRT